MNLTVVDRETWLQRQMCQPFTGYLVIGNELMQAPGFTDFLFDHFRYVATITTADDTCNNLTRLLLRADCFNCGFGQYNLDIECGKDYHRRITKIEFIQRS